MDKSPRNRRDLKTGKLGRERRYVTEFSYRKPHEPSYGMILTYISKMSCRSWGQLGLPFINLFRIPAIP
ncbi:hypothetical protein ElyMa_004428400 [Elysia marginata]|uniref:Uncharacterized protein n=1 Tax=Elysia marginata TaxID=1093978 RepID=A0AAV4HB53_9GAST|nr:hypothetical protein ElyMa_004428400 [Elysia marginata]